MAELTVHIRAIYDEVIESRNELAKVEKQMKDLNANSSAKDVQRLMNEYNQLYKKWEDGMTRLGKIGAYARNAVGQVNDALGDNAELIEHIDKASSNMTEKVAKRAKAELDINEALRKQREELLANRKEQEQIYKKAKANLELAQKEYNAKPESERTADDKLLINLYEEEYRGVKKTWDEINDKVAVYDSMLKVSADRLEKMTKQILEAHSGFDGIDNSEALTQMRNDANVLIEALQNASSEVERIQGEMSNDKGFFSRLFDGSDDIEKTNQQVEDFGKAANEAFGIANTAMEAQQKYVDELTRKLEEYEQKIAEATDPKDVEKLQTTFAALKAEQQAALGVLESIKDVMNELGDDIDNAEGMKAQSDKISSLHEKLSKLKELFTRSGADEMEGDVDKLEKRVSSASDTFTQFYQKAENSTNSLKSSLKQLATMAGLAFGVRELGGFMGKVMQTREYFQDIESSMKVFLGSAEAGAEFTEKLKDYAYYNMFEFSDLAQASQQMISYGHNVENIIPRLDQLSNVATGTHGSLMELVDAYNRAKATGVVDARGVQSWAVKGVMIRDVLRDMGEQASGTTITFEQLNKVLDKVTGEGGQFHNLMLEMMDNISAEKGQLEDNLSSMYNAIGEQYQSIIVKWYKFQSELVDNYETIGGDVLDLGAKFAEWGIDELRENIVSLIGYLKNAIVVFGTWKVTIAALTPIHKAITWWTGAEAMAHDVNTGKIKLEGVARGQATAAIVRQTQAQKMLNATVLASPWTWLAAILTGAVYTIYSYYDGLMTAEKATKMLSSANEDYADSLKDSKDADLANLRVLRDKTSTLVEQTKAYRELTNARKIFSQYTPEQLSKMSDEQFQNLWNQDTKEQIEQNKRNQIKALEELEEWRKAHSGIKSVTSVFDFDEEIDRVAKANNLSEEQAKAWKDSIGWMTKYKDWIAETLAAAKGEVQKDLTEGAQDGIVEGMRKGFTNADTETFAMNTLSSLKNQYEGLKPLEEEFARLPQAIADAQEQLDKTPSGMQEWKNINDRLQAMKSRFAELSQLLPSLKDKIQDAFNNSVTTQIDSANAKIKELNDKLLEAPEEKKVEIQTQLTQAENEKNVLEGILKLVESGKTDTDVVINVATNAESVALGDEKLVEIAEGYKKIEDVGQAVALKMQHAKEEFDGLTLKSAESAKEIAEKYGITADDIETAFGDTTKEVTDDIDRIKREIAKAQAESKDTGKLTLELQRKQEQLDYINNIKSSLKFLTDDPWNLFINIKTLIPDSVKKALKEWFGIDFTDAENNQQTKAERAKQEGYEAQGRIDEKNKPSEPRGNYQDYQKRKKQREKQEDDEYRIFKQGGVSKTRKDANGNYINYGKLTDKEIEDMEKSFAESAKREKAGAKGSKDILQRRQRDYDMFLKNREQQQKQEIDSLNATEEARIAQEENATKREKMERKNRFRLAEQSVKEQEEAFKKANVEQIKAEWQNKKENKDKIWADTKTAQDVKANGYANIALTELQQAQIDAMREKNFQEEKRYQREIQEAQLTELYDYLKEYGTFQEAKYAITKEYAKKIAEAEEAGDTIRAKKLKAERDKNLSGAKARELSQGIDFSQISYGLSDVMDGIMRETLQRIRDYRVTDEYKSSSPESKKAIADLEKQLLDKGAGGSISPFGSWAEINKHAEEFDKAIIRTTKAQKMHEIASKNLAAQEEMLKKKRNDPKASPIEIRIQEGIVNSAKKAFEQTGKELKDAQTAQEDSGQQVQTDLTEVDKGLQEFNAILGQITSGSLSGFADGVANLVTKITKGGDAAAKGLAGLGKAGGIISAILAVIDALGDKPVEFIDELFKKIVNAISAILQNLPEIIGSIIKGVGKLIGGIFGSIGSWFGIDFSSSNRARIEEENNKLANATMVNTEAINRLTEEMKKVNPAEAYNNYMQALHKMQQNEENAKRTMHNNAEMHDGGHSLWYDFGGRGVTPWGQILEDRGDALVRKIYTALGKKYTDEGLATMVQTFSAADWNRLLKERPDLMTKLGEAISEAEDEGNYNGLFKDILDFANEFSEEAYEGLRRAFQEAVTFISFDSMYSSFVSSLMDMDKKAQDFTQDFEGYLRNAIYQAMATDALKPLLEDWYDAFTHAMKSKEANGQYLSDKEIQALMSTGGTYTDEEGNNKTFKSLSNIEDTAIQMRNGIEQLGLYNGKNGNQSATANSISNISYDQADSLVGIGMAQQMAIEQSRDRLDILNTRFDDVMGGMVEQRNISADSREILAGMAIHVEEIRDGVVDTIVPRIKTMSDDLSKVRKYVEEQ